ncbi:Uncharacterised protein [Candidatus Gugararchaeum adminiculabundum]|nr:Uncharacterised protein [Candidatus Gugararchaeum adminiculabundum]
MKSTVIVPSPEASEAYSVLEKQAPTSKISRSILNGLKKKSDLIKADIHYGDSIAKSLIPQEYILKYNVTNLFRVELPNFWRMLYTIKAKDAEIAIVILDILDHDEYNKKFGYRKK